MSNKTKKNISDIDIHNGLNGLTFSEDGNIKYVPVFNNKKVVNCAIFKDGAKHKYCRSIIFHSGYFTLGKIEAGNNIYICNSIDEVLTIYTDHGHSSAYGFTKKARRKLISNLKSMGCRVMLSSSILAIDTETHIVSEDDKIIDPPIQIETISKVESTETETVYGKVYDGESLTRQISSGRWLIRGFIPKGPLIGFIYGPSGVGKTFVCLDMCLHIAAGYSSWHGFICHGAKVLYIAGESAEAINVRVAAFAKKYGLDFAKNFYCFFDDKPLSDPEGLKEIESKIDSGLVPFTPDVIVFDTFNCYYTDDENDSSAIGRFKMTRILPLQRRYGCNMLFVHHTSKANEEEMRGATAIKGMSDYTILINREETDQLKVSISKSRVGGEGTFEQCKLQKVELDWSPDEDGFIPSGAVIEHCCSSNAAATVSAKGKENLQILVDAMILHGSLSSNFSWEIEASVFRSYLKDTLKKSENDIKKTFSNTENRFFPELIQGGYVMLKKEVNKIIGISIISEEKNKEISKKKDDLGSKVSGTIC